MTSLHAMIDIETLGTVIGSPITQIGIAEFVPETRQVEPVFEVSIDPQSCFDAGMMPSWSTIEFWFQQPDEARAKMMSRQALSLTEALARVRDELPWERYAGVWALGPQFDIAMLDFAFSRAAMPSPWGYRQPRDLRTLASLVPDGEALRPEPTLAHDALADATAQAHWAVALIQRLRA